MLSEARGESLIELTPLARTPSVGEDHPTGTFFLKSKLRKT